MQCAPRKTHRITNIFPDPDLTPIVIPDEMIEEITLTMPELPEPKKRRYVTEYGLPEYDASILTGSKYLVQLFEQTVTLCGNPKEVSNWIMGDVMMLLKNSGKDAEELDIFPRFVCIADYHRAEGLYQSQRGQKGFGRRIRRQSGSGAVCQGKRLGNR